MTLIILSVLIGIVAGLRAMTAPASGCAGRTLWRDRGCRHRLH
jgi:uncharacterized membrane protein